MCTCVLYWWVSLSLTCCQCTIRTHISTKHTYRQEGHAFGCSCRHSHIHMNNSSRYQKVLSRPINRKETLASEAGFGDGFFRFFFFGVVGLGWDEGMRSSEAARLSLLEAAEGDVMLFLSSAAESKLPSNLRRTNRSSVWAWPANPSISSQRTSYAATELETIDSPTSRKTDSITVLGPVPGRCLRTLGPRRLGW